MPDISLRVGERSLLTLSFLGPRKEPEAVEGDPTFTFDKPDAGAAVKLGDHVGTAAEAWFRGLSPDTGTLTIGADADLTAGQAIISRTLSYEVLAEQATDITVAVGPAEPDPDFGLAEAPTPPPPAAPEAVAAA